VADGFEVEGEFVIIDIFIYIGFVVINGLMNLIE
jgi:hypothetical protein